MPTYYKGARLDGYDFYTGKTINYRDNIGKIVQCPNKGTPDLCSSTVIHASKKPQNIFIGSKIPCSIFVVEGNPVVEDHEKSGFKQLKIIKEIPEMDFDELLGFKYSGVINPLNPFNIEPPIQITDDIISILKEWNSVLASVWASVLASVRDSVLAVEYAYIGSLFSSISKWEYTENIKTEREYPFESCILLLKMGIIPSFDGKIWRLHTKNGIIWSGKV